MHKDYVEMSLQKRIMAFLSIGVIYFFYCYNFSITAIYKPILVDNYGFSASDLSDAFALMSFGTLLGTLLAGFLASKLNKKVALIIMGLGFSVPTLLHIPFFESYTGWVFLRLIAGTSLGGIFGTAVALICDMFPPRYRGRLTSVASSLFALAFSFGFWVSSVFQNTNQYMVLLVGALTPLVGVALTALFVPNTDAILSKSDAQEEGEKNKTPPSYLSFVKSAPPIVVLAVLLSGMNFTGYSGFTNNSSLFISRQVVQSIEDAVKEGILISQEETGYKYQGEGEVIVDRSSGESERRRLSFGDSLSSQEAMLVLQNKARAEASRSMSFVGNGHFFGFLFFGFIGDAFGRKKNILGMLLSALAGMGILLVPYSGTITPYIILGVAMGFGFGFSGVWGAYYSELFDPQYRGMAAGFCFNMGRIVSMISVPFIGRLVDSWGVSKALWVPLGAFIIGILVWGSLPETLKKRVKGS